jgi:4-hydroxybenzoyl-CoA reductase subunit alpha
MGVGQALSEEAAFRNGLPLHSSFLDYRIPTIKDSPPIEIKIIESMDPNGPFGAKEASEGPSGSIAPAIANAVYKAVKKRINELPLTPERVFAAEDREEKRTAKFEWR